MHLSSLVSAIIAVCCCLSLVNAFQGNETMLGAYDGTQALKSIWLSAAAYCGKNSYKSHVFKGPTSGFVVTDIIYDSLTDTQGYIGYLPSDKSIYVTFRGSSSIKNWVTNLDAVKTAYTTFPECNCQVHKGFFDAEQKVFPAILTAVKKLRSVYPTYSLKVTGHSLGAALAQLTAMDLIKNGLSNSVYNFGMPRTGDDKYAAFSTAKSSIWRVTHNKDTVPHVPYTSMGFAHVCQEEFEDSVGKMKACTAGCEDASCANQYPFAQTNVDDHLVYLGLSVSCAAVS